MSLEWVIKYVHVLEQHIHPSIPNTRYLFRRLARKRTAIYIYIYIYIVGKKGCHKPIFSVFFCITSQLVNSELSFVTMNALTQNNTRWYQMYVYSILIKREKELHKTGLYFNKQIILILKSEFHQWTHSLTCMILAKPSMSLSHE